MNGGHYNEAVPISRGNWKEEQLYLEFKCKATHEIYSNEWIICFIAHNKSVKEKNSLNKAISKLATITIQSFQYASLNPNSEIA